MGTNLQKLRGKIKGHILAIREDVKNAGFDTSYISIAIFDDVDGYRAHAVNSVEIEPEKRFKIFYDLEEEE